MTVAHRIGVMDGGRLEQVATPAEIYEQPCSRWVASFIGDVNVFEGRIVATDNGGTLIETGQGRRLRVAGQSNAPAGATVWIALRPEKIEMSTSDPIERRENCVSGRVWDIAYLGDISIYKVRLDDGFEIKASLVNRTTILQRPISRDDVVWLTWTPEAGVLLTR